MTATIGGATGEAATRWRHRAARLALAASAARLALVLHAGFRPEQPRVPAGNPHGGRWTKVPGSAQGDGTRDDLHLVGGRGRRPRGGQIRINGRWLAATQAQQTRIAVTKRAMDRAVAEAKRLDPRWRPRSQLTETVEGYIRANEANRLEAELKIYELTGRPPNLGPFAVEWLPSPPNGRALNSAERLRLDAIGQKYGCHGCGSTTNLTPNRHSVADHQIPTALGVPTRILPHCVHCSALQGGFVRGFLWRLSRD